MPESCSISGILCKYDGKSNQQRLQFPAIDAHMIWNAKNLINKQKSRKPSKFRKQLVFKALLPFRAVVGFTIEVARESCWFLYYCSVHVVFAGLFLRCLSRPAIKAFCEEESMMASEDAALLLLYLASKNLSLSSVWGWLQSCEQ